jgi:putative tryptophan/tyrosine transport system substrate-binding protein
MRRRAFIAGVGSVAAWPAVTRAQTERMRRVAALTQSGGPATQALFAIFSSEMAKLGWVEGRNLRLDLRFGGDDEERIRAYATELVNLGPDVIVATGVPATLTVQEKTQAIPIVMIGGGDVFAPASLRTLLIQRAMLPESPIYLVQ